MNSWNFGITYSINKSYSFNKTFESPQLKITSQVINKKNDSSVLPFVVTIKYVTDIGDIEDLTFSLLPGFDKPITTIVYVPTNGYPYRVTIDNPNKIIMLKLETLKIQRKIMPTHQPMNNDALVAAINAQTAATIQSATPEVLDTETIGYSALGTAQVSAENDSNRGLTITATSAGKYRIYMGDSYIAAPSFADTNYLVELSDANASHELASGWNSNVWVVCDNGAGTVSVFRTFVKPQFVVNP